MTDFHDVYTDGFNIALGPLGHTLIFSMTAHEMPTMGVPATPKIVSVIRMSPETAKFLTFTFVRNIKNFERHQQVSAPISVGFLNSASISPEDWSDFWKL